MKRVSVSVVIPAFNERKTIREIIKRVKQSTRDLEIIVVDDGSTDGTRQILKEYDGDEQVRVILQPENGGKGRALRTGFLAATKDVVLVQDADLEYDPDDYEALLRPLDQGRADVVYGSRFQYGERRVLFFRHALGNKLLTFVSNLFTDLNLTDMETCYKVFKREIIQNVDLRSDRFGFEPEITVKIARLGCVVYEVPVRYYGRSYADGKKITWKDGFAAFWHIVRYSLVDRRFVKDAEAIRRVQVSPPPIPDVGVETLEAFEDARRYNRWIFERMRPAVGLRVLEVGSGIGNIVAELLTCKSVRSVVATDLRLESLHTLKDRFGDDTRLSCAVWDAPQPPPDALRSEGFDTIICSNVLEHIEDHRQALAHMRGLLKPGGCLILLVPANPRLFCGLDRDLGHFRRYTRADLRQVLEDAGFTVDQLVEHNAAGVVGWWWVGTVLGRNTLRRRDTRRFDRLVPVLMPVDAVLVRVFGGVSVLAVSSPASGGL